MGYFDTAAPNAFVCGTCGASLASGNPPCPSCLGMDIKKAGGVPVKGEPPKPTVVKGSVRITGIDIPFGDMVQFFVMATLAAIPAGLILLLLGALIVVFFGGLLSGL